MTMGRWIFCLLAPVLIGFGCGTTHPDKSDFLSDQSTLHQGKYLQRWWTAGPIDKATLAKIYIEPVDVTRIKDYPEISASDASNFVANTVFYRFWSNDKFTVVTNPADATVKIQLAITYLTPGNAAVRRNVAQWGLGYANVQLEGKVFDSKGAEIACFKERRYDSGSLGYEDYDYGNSGHKLVRRMLEEICTNFVKELTAASQ